MRMVDAHMHLWDPARGDYGWLTPDNTSLYRRFSRTDAEPLLSNAGIDSVVLVQAAPTVAETDYLLSIADATPWVAGVVGWVDLDAADIDEQIARRSGNSKFVGIRPMLQDIPEVSWVLDPHRVRGLEALMQRQLVFDALIRPAHLDTMVKIADQYPNLAIVLDHAAKPVVEASLDPHWLKGLRLIARRANVSCKLSGLASELRSREDIKHIGSYIQILLEVFTPSRLIWGSDWPVLTTTMSYEDWHGLSTQCLANLNAVEFAAVMGKNAIATYALALE
jgi:L-fuconolactonase